MSVTTPLIECLSAASFPKGAELLVLPIWEGGSEAADLSAWKELLAPVLRSGDFKAKAGDGFPLYEKEGTTRVLLLGLGKPESLDAETLRRTYSTAVRFAQAKKVKTLHLVFPSQHKISREKALIAIGEGLFLTNYAFSYAKEESATLLEKIVFLGVEEAEKKVLLRRQVIASGVHLIRELVNRNADDVTPQMLAETALSLEKRSRNLKTTILDRKQIEKEKMGLFLAVTRGSSVEPALIQVAYNGNSNSKEHIVLIGKGITYDTGGLSLKPTDGMLTMKCDMAGAALMLATVTIAAELNLSVNVTALVPAAENAIDAKSYKLGDVYHAMNGKSVEINNTDAEGRLVLADAITYAKRHLRPTLLIDAATLTGGIVVALGEEIAGLFGNSEELLAKLVHSSKTSNELIWQMPLHTDYRELLKSDIADLVNSAGRSASSMTAALFLHEFVESTPWAHLDIAGTAFLTKPKYYNTSKATGFGLRLLIDFLESR